MVDFHSHILPEIDDGSKSVEESIELLRMLKEQNITKVCATPHYNAKRESVDSFLLRRDEALVKLQSELPPDLPEIIPGAEVAYFVGISNLASLDKLCLSGSRLLLLEMPMGKWASHWVSEVELLSVAKNCTVVLAHIERYLGDGNREYVKRLVDNGVLLQVNSGFFDGFFSKIKAFSLMNKEGINFIGSDCHGINRRPPTIGKAYECIEKKMGKDFIKEYFDYQISLLSTD
ncbi:MAG: capsular polysaccharide biosynthesis protein [Eubacteriales bacterium]|nr:capsular polysaccharide biosynthesis protein [Eubacteriales bacterium]